MGQYLAFENQRYSCVGSEWEEQGNITITFRLCWVNEMIVFSSMLTVEHRVD